jgi:hypothetical protein
VETEGVFLGEHNADPLPWFIDEALSQMSEVDRRITDPHPDVPFLEWYRGIFDAVFIALHPFCAIKDFDPALAQRAVNVISREDLPERISINPIVALSKAQNLEKESIKVIRLSEKTVGKPVYWDQIRKACGFESLAQLNRALLTITMAISEKLADGDAAQRLGAYCGANKIFLPTEDTFPPILEQTIAGTIDQLGCEQMYLSDEFNQHRQILLRRALHSGTPWADEWRLRSNKLYPVNHSFLLIVPHDNFYTAICGKRSQFDALNLETCYEGFWCDNQTRPDWWH